MSFPLSVRKPLIAAINGACAGVGLVQTLYCDVRFAATDAKLTTAFTRLGLPAEYGVAWLLPPPDRLRSRERPPGVGSRPHRRGGRARSAWSSS